jgi:hypothetical protein
MIYIVTYATHNERYFDILKQSCPDIIVLGYGKKWNGFSDKVNAVVEFCKSKNPDDIVCFVDGFDSIILSSKEEILEKYKKFNAPLVFSKDIPNITTIHKYIKDKIFYGRCKEEVLNSIKNLDVEFSKKILYLLIDSIHISFIFFIYYLFFNYECNIQKLLFLNIVFFIHILLFFYFKRCIITIISNKVINAKEENVWKGLPHRLFYFLDLKSSYTSDNIKNPSEEWMKGNRINIIIIILLNIYCLWKINRGTTCIRKNGYGKIDFNKIIRKFY